jgi:hypothetical protein
VVKNVVQVNAMPRARKPDDEAAVVAFATALEALRVDVIDGVVLVKEAASIAGKQGMEPSFLATLSPADARDFALGMLTVAKQSRGVSDFMPDLAFLKSPVGKRWAAIASRALKKLGW